MFSACSGEEAQREGAVLGRVEDNAGPRISKYKPAMNAISLDVWGTASQPGAAKPWKKLLERGEREKANRWIKACRKRDLLPFHSLHIVLCMSFPVLCTLPVLLQWHFALLLLIAPGNWAPLLGAEARGCNHRSGLWALRTTEHLIFFTGLNLLLPLKEKSQPCGTVIQQTKTTGLRSRRNVQSKLHQMLLLGAGVKY